MVWQVPYLFVFLVMINALFFGAQVYKQQSYKTTETMHAQKIMNEESDRDAELSE